VLTKFKTSSSYSLKLRELKRAESEIARRLEALEVREANLAAREASVREIEINLHLEAKRLEGLYAAYSELGEV
jgi:hypothetical protein